MYDFIIKYPFLIIFIIYIAYSLINGIFHSSLLTKIGKEFCKENNYEYVNIKSCKSHFSVVYKTPESGRRKYKKFRMNNILNKVKYLEWLE